MKRQVPGLHEATPFPDGFFLVRIAHAQYRPTADKPFVALVLAITAPASFSGRKIPTRLYCTEKALWKLNWFLRDFAYDPELLGRDEIDDRAIVYLLDKLFAALGCNGSEVFDQVFNLLAAGLAQRGSTAERRGIALHLPGIELIAADQQKQAVT